MCAAWRAFHELNEFYRILDDLWPERAARGRLLLRGVAAPVLHFALVKSHVGIVANRMAVVNPSEDFRDK